MIGIAIYSIIALGILLLAGWLIRQALRDAEEADLPRSPTLDLLDLRSLSLAERIFDPADYLWLRDKVCFPHLARLLKRSRRQMALICLKGLRRSFDDLVRVPETPSARYQAEDNFQRWQLLWLILRFHFLLGYAIVVVRLFGPYHRLVPSLRWVRPLPEPATESVVAKRLL